MFNSFYGKVLKDCRSWVASGFRTPPVKENILDFLRHLTVESPVRKYEVLWPHQREAVIRAIYTNELLKPTDEGFKDILLNVVTGGGKTTIIAALL